ncbi:unnamed protein product [Lota lota]
MPKFDPNTWQETLGPADVIRAGWLNEAPGSCRGVLMSKGQFESQPGILLDSGMRLGGTVTRQAHRHTDPRGTAVVVRGGGGWPTIRSQAGRAEPAGEDALTALKVTPPGSSTQGTAGAAREHGSQREKVTFKMSGQIQLTAHATLYTNTPTSRRASANPLVSLLATRQLKCLRLEK